MDAPFPATASGTGALTGFGRVDPRWGAPLRPGGFFHHRDSENTEEHREGDTRKRRGAKTQRGSAVRFAQHADCVRWVLARRGLRKRASSARNDRKDGASRLAGLGSAFGVRGNRRGQRTLPRSTVPDTKYAATFSVFLKSLDQRTVRYASLAHSAKTLNLTTSSAPRDENW